MTSQNKRNDYREALNEIKAMLAGNNTIDFKKAVFITENAYLDDKLSNDSYNDVIDFYSSICKGIAESDAITYVESDKEDAMWHISQNDNPFAEFGYDVLVGTSSKGEYEEFHDQTDIVEVGSVLFNTRTNKIVRILDKDETTLDIPSAITAMSIDPLCEKYYWISPYVYAMNNPMKFIDIDGRAPGDVVVAFGGADLWKDRNTGKAFDIHHAVVLNDRYMDNIGTRVQSFSSDYWGSSLSDSKSLDDATQEAYDFVKENYNYHNDEFVGTGKVIIEGYSYGGVLATHLSSRLGKDGISYREVDFGGCSSRS